MADNSTVKNDGNVVAEAPKKPVETESHLSETARFVLPFLQKITGRLRDQRLVAQANDLIVRLTAGTITHEDPSVINFILSCGKEKDVIIAELEKENSGPKGKTVVGNFFTKFLNKEIKKTTQA